MNGFFKNWPGKKSESNAEAALRAEQKEVGSRLFKELQAALAERPAELGEMRLSEMPENGGMYSVVAQFNGATIQFNVTRDAENKKLVLNLPVSWASAAGEDPKEYRDFTDENFAAYLEDARQLIKTKQ